MVVAAGALCAVCRFKSVVVPVLKPPLAVGGYTCRNWPVALTTLPFLSSENSPLREYTVPLASWRVKNPSPLMARSKLDEVVVMLPWLNCWALSSTRTPSPLVDELRFTEPAA